MCESVERIKKKGTQGLICSGMSIFTAQMAEIKRAKKAEHDKTGTKGLKTANIIEEAKEIEEEEEEVLN